MPVIEGPGIVMDHMSAKAQFFQIIGNTFTGALLENRLIGYSPGPK